MIGCGGEQTFRATEPVAPHCGSRGLTAGGDLDDFDDVAVRDRGGVDFAGEEGFLVALDHDGFAGEAEGVEQVSDGGGGLEGAGLAVDGEGH